MILIMKMESMSYPIQQPWTSQKHHVVNLTPPESPDSLLAIPVRSLTQPSTMGYKPQLSTEEWAALRPEIERLYIHEEQTFEHVAAYLRDHHNFNPTIRQFRRRVMAWGLKKNTKKSERDAILAKVNSGTVIEKVRVGTVAVNRVKLKRWRAGYSNGPRGAKRDSQSSNSSSPSDTALVFHRSPVHTVHIPRQPTAPQAYYRPEELFFNIRTYVNGCFDGRIWAPDDDGNCINIVTNTGDSHCGDVGKYLGSCTSAMHLIQQKSFTEARRVLSVACSLLRSILEREEPDTLNWLLLSFYHLKSAGLYDIIAMLQKYIYGLAVTVLPMHHPWRSICILLGTVTNEQLDACFYGGWLCIAENLSAKLGPLHPTTLDVRLNSTRVSTDPRGQEATLRMLQAETLADLGDSKQLFMIQGPLARNLTMQQRYIEAEEVALDTLARTRNFHDPAYKINALQFLAEVRIKLGKRLEAESHFREAVWTFRNEMNDGDYTIWIIRILGKLQTWMQEWGWDEKASVLKAEIDLLIEPDEVDKENGNG